MDTNIITGIYFIKIYENCSEDKNSAQKMSQCNNRSKKKKKKETKDGSKYEEIKKEGAREANR